MSTELELIPKHLAKFEIDENSCWIWLGSLSRDGYGWVSLDNRTRQAHRLIYQIAVGPIPDGLVIDHLCRVRRCVNPDHLEPVTPAENLLRSSETTSGMKVCRKGHQLEPLRGQRRCPTCNADYELRRRSRKAEGERKRRAMKKGEAA